MTDGKDLNAATPIKRHRCLAMHITDNIRLINLPDEYGTISPMMSIMFLIKMKN